MIALWIALSVVAAGVFGLARVRRRPHPWSHARWVLAVRPRADVHDMTRRELFESAAGFVTWTLLAVIALQLTMLAVPANSGWPRALSAAVAVVLVIGGCGAAYMLLRGALRRQTYLSHERFSAELGVMRYWICRADWIGLERHFRSFAERTCGREVAEHAAAIDLTAYRRELESALRQALVAATGEQPTVIVYLHRPDDMWTGAFCVYRRSAPRPTDLSQRSDPCLAEVPGPACEPLAQLCVAHGGALNAIALFLIARTVGELGRCTDAIPLGGRGLCMGFEGDGGLLWLREPRASLDTRVN